MAIILRKYFLFILIILVLICFNHFLSTPNVYAQYDSVIPTQAPEICNVIPMPEGCGNCTSDSDCSCTGGATPWCYNGSCHCTSLLSPTDAANQCGGWGSCSSDGWQERICDNGCTCGSGPSSCCNTQTRKCVAEPTDVPTGGDNNTPRPSNTPHPGPPTLPPTLQYHQLHLNLVRSD